jgi:hypothetical protein
MGTAVTSTNGCYLISSDGKKFPVKRSLLDAVERMIESEGTGEVH